MRRIIVDLQRMRSRDTWPIDGRAGEHPFGWKGWPGSKKFAFILMHDVDNQIGHDKTLDLMKIEEEMGFRSVFNFVPERYPVSPELRKEINNRSFGIGVHGLKHDGKLFASYPRFKKRSLKINNYLHEWNTRGFSSPSMHHNLDWMSCLDINYATSTFDTDPFEPQPDGVRTIFPFWVPRNSWPNGYVELPYTIPQDFTLFILLQEQNVQIWKDKLDWIAEKGGMALMNSHPDYMSFNKKNNGTEEYPLEYFTEFLDYVKTRYKNQYWHPLPDEMAVFWRKNQVEKVFSLAGQ